MKSKALINAGIFGDWRFKLKTAKALRTVHLSGRNTHLDEPRVASPGLVSIGTSPVCPA